MTDRTPSCGCGPAARPMCGRCAPPAATGAQLRLSAPVRVPLDDDRRRGALAALAALLAPYLTNHHQQGKGHPWPDEP